MGTHRLTISWTLLLLGAWGCDNQTGPAQDTVLFLSASPAGGSINVAPEGPLMLHFSGPMMSGMEQYVDLHRGGLQDPTVPMHCTWSSDRTTLTCQPEQRLEHGTRYTTHMGGGMRDAAGHSIDMEEHMDEMGGHWADSASSGGMHSGGHMGDMSEGWQAPNGSVGMAFEFTTS